MEKLLIITMLLFSGSILAQTGSIELNIKGINPKKGKEIRIAVYTKAGFLEKMFIQKIAVSKGKTKSVKLDDIQVGTYAIGVFQDENSDEIMNKNFMGKPIELNGFSKDAKGNFGPPKFKDAAFDVLKDQNTSLTIQLEK